MMLRSVAAFSPSVRTLGASGTSSLRSSSTLSMRASPASSTLLRRTRSVHLAWILAVREKLLIRMKLAQSTTVTTPSTRTMSDTFSISHTSGPGIAEPLASTRIRCGPRSCSARKASARSPTLVQRGSRLQSPSPRRARPARPSRRRPRRRTRSSATRVYPRRQARRRADHRRLARAQAARQRGDGHDAQAGATGEADRRRNLRDALAARPPRRARRATQQLELARERLAEPASDAASRARSKSTSATLNFTLVTTLPNLASWTSPRSSCSPSPPACCPRAARASHRPAPRAGPRWAVGVVAMHRRQQETKQRVALRRGQRDRRARGAEPSRRPSVERAAGWRLEGEERADRGAISIPQIDLRQAPLRRRAALLEGHAGHRSARR